MISLLRSPWPEHFDYLIGKASSSLVIASPYIGKGPCQRIISLKRKTTELREISILLVTDLSRETVLSGATDASAIYEMVGLFSQIEVRFLPSIHAKVYVADDQIAVVTSSNMTNNGLLNNFEYGVKIEDRAIVAKVKKDITDYAALGTRIDKERIGYLAKTSAELNDMRVAAERSIKKRLRNEFKRRLDMFESEILKTRAAGRAPHTIFAEAILYLLSQKPISTQQLHPLIKSIHPDLCDDTVDRVIDGKHFGKKWKHAVRTAQQHLKRIGKIELKNGVWRLRSS